MRRIDRFDLYMKEKGLNDNQVTKALSLTIGRIGNSRREKRDLSNEMVEMISNFYADLNKSWLLTGEGEMLKSSDTISNNTISNSTNSVIGGDNIVVNHDSIDKLIEELSAQRKLTELHVIELTEQRKMFQEIIMNLMRNADKS